MNAIHPSFQKTSGNYRSFYVAWKTRGHPKNQLATNEAPLEAAATKLPGRPADQPSIIRLTRRAPRFMITSMLPS